jgi:hypothetical protein
MGPWDEVPCPGYFDGAFCPEGCPLRVEEHADLGPPGKTYCAGPCLDGGTCPLGLTCYEDKYCVFGPCDPDPWDCRRDTACYSDLPFCAPSTGILVACAPFRVDDAPKFACPDGGCPATLELPDGTTFCTLDCAFADPNNPCVQGALCPWDSPPLPDGRTLCLPICESDADCFGGLTCTDGVCQWPAAMR